MIDRLKKIIDEEDSDDILPEPPAEMPQRPQLPILGQIVRKVKEIDDKKNEGNAKLIEQSNQLFEEDQAMVNALVLQMQPNQAPSLFELQESKQKIECLFEFTKTDGSNGKFNFWCVGIIIDVCDGSEIDKWKRLRGFYNDGQAAEVHWEAVLGHEESKTVEEFKPTLFNRHSLGGWRYYYK